MATDQETSTARSDVSRPSHDAVYCNLVELRRYGLASSLRDGKLDDLLWVVHIISDGSADIDSASLDGDNGDSHANAAKIEQALKPAIETLGGRAVNSVMMLFGLTDETRNVYPKQRRELAAAAHTEPGKPAMNGESFRSHYQQALLMMVATRLFFLADERILKAWEARLEMREARLATEQASFRVKPAPDGPADMPFISRQPPKSGSFFDDDFDDPPPRPRPRVEVVQSVRRVKEGPENIATALSQIGDEVTKILTLIVGLFESPGHYRNEYTFLQKIIVIALLTIILLLIGSTLLGTYEIVQFIAHRIVEI